MGLLLCLVSAIAALPAFAQAPAEQARAIEADHQQMLQQLGITPGKDILMLGSGGTNEFVADIKAGTVYGTVALYPSTESYIGIKDLVAAIKGQKGIPTTVNVIDKNHPLIITAKTLKTATGFKPDWSLTGAPG